MVNSSNNINLNRLSLVELVRILDSHKGFFIIEGIKYDNVLYCGTDNLYFSYCFNFKTGRAITETLLIVDTIIKQSDDCYFIGSVNKECFIFLEARLYEQGFT